jgi:hypothetical protein
MVTLRLACVSGMLPIAMSDVKAKGSKEHRKGYGTSCFRTIWRGVFLTHLLRLAPCYDRNQELEHRLHPCKNNDTPRAYQTRGHCLQQNFASAIGKPVEVGVRVQNCFFT